jgi:hypothetical protein
VRTNLSFGELAHGAAQEELFVGEAEVHRRRDYRMQGRG